MTILIAEDDTGLRYTIWRLLRADGHRVIATSDGEAALKVVRSRGFPIDLILADLDLPKINGLELCRSITTEHPQIRVLVMSDGNRGRADIEAAGLPVLMKPFTAAAIRRSVGAILGRSTVSDGAEALQAASGK